MSATTLREGIGLCNEVAAVLKQCTEEQLDALAKVGYRDFMPDELQGVALGLQEVLAGLDWLPMETAPHDGTPILALLEAEELFSRVHVATLHPKIATVGGHFEFDMPKMIGWRPILGIPA